MIEENKILKKIEKYKNKPALYEKSTAKFWDDEHISKYMLEAHLNKDWDAATRNHRFVDKSVNWIASVLPADRYNKLLDLGCGPGIYDEKFYIKGYNITGVDLSSRSIEYARASSAKNNYSINYICKSYLDLSYSNEYDIITLIYCDFGVLSTEDRRKLLKIIYAALKPGGAFVVDVFTPKQHEGRQENHTWQYYETGFYSENPYLELDSYYRYDEDNTALDQYIIISDDNVNCYNIWDHTFTVDELINDMTEAGFESTEIFGDVAGKEYDENSKTICLIARKGE